MSESFMNHKKTAISTMKKLGYKVLKIVDKSKGCDHKILLLYTDKGNFVYRYCKNDRAIMSHAYACKMWHKLPLPKTVLATKYYMMETMLPGKDMSESKLTRKQIIQIMKHVGKIMRQMHKVKTERYGYLKSPGIGQVNSWKKYILRLTKRKLKNIPISKDLLQEVKTYLKKNVHNLDFYKPVLLHKDINPENIMVYEGKLSGIIDAADTLSGDPMYDIAVMYDRFRNWDQTYPDTLAKTYGKINKEKLHYYQIINAVRRIYVKKENGEPTQKSIENLKRLISN